MDIPTTYLVGLFWILAGGLAQGAFPLPMKFTRNWKWEHLWFWYSMIAFFLLPLGLAVATVPELATVYRVAPPGAILSTALFGMGWGAGSILFGLGLDALGLALGFPLMSGLFTALGALIPLAVLTPDLLFRRPGLLIIAGNVVTIAGVAICGLAGHLRDRTLGAKTAAIIGPARSFAMGLTICVFAGVLSALFNFGYAFGSGIVTAAIDLGATKSNALNALWLVELFAGGLLNVGYCVYLCQRNHSAKLLIRRVTVAEWSGALAMGVLWTGSVILFGWGANDLGRLGPSLGWSVFNAIIIVTTVLCGLLTHEWDGARGRPARLLFIGCAVLLVGMFVLGMSAC